MVAQRVDVPARSAGSWPFYGRNVHARSLPVPAAVTQASVQAAETTGPPTVGALVALSNGLFHG